MSSSDALSDKTSLVAEPSAAHTKMVKARSELVLDHPFFGTLALRLCLREDPSCETAWSNGRLLSFNPAYIDALSPDKVKGLVGHEIMHLACGHHLRRGDRDHKMWNRACDLAINWILLDAGLTLPEGFLDDPALRHLEVEAIYDRLLEDSEREEEGSEHLGGQGEERDQDGGTGSSGGQDGHSTPRGGENRPDDKQGRQEERARLGGGDQEKASSSQDDYGDPGKSGEVRDGWDPEDGHPSPNELKDMEIRNEVDLALAVNQAKALGKLPDGVARLVEETLYPKLSWGELLRRFVEHTARNDYTWNPPNRRYIHTGLYLPSVKNEELPEIVIGVDTSGSISQQELDQFAAEVSAVLQDFDTRINLVYCDSAIAGVQEFSRYDLPLYLQPRGGGGTDYRPVFRLVEERGLQPACLVYLTDLECINYPATPDYPVLWVSTQVDRRVPPFGEVIHLSL
ncbi:MAG: hypothetical protein CSA21_05695 [Deltaproteobacteria bacterium]|nr:MAG: hypothetical protein CSA21_05695 [Deltaproteobacteria bacterium]